MESVADHFLQGVVHDSPFLALAYFKQVWFLRLA